MNFLDFLAVFDGGSGGVRDGPVLKSICRKDRHGGLGVSLHGSNVNTQQNNIFCCVFCNVKTLQSLYFLAFRAFALFADSILFVYFCYIST